MRDSPVDLRLIEQVRARVTPHIARTPLYRSTTLSDILDRDIHLKLENLQFTGSFKERGAVAKLSTLTQAEREVGVITMSAGNHAQAVARHAKRLGVKATIVMPRTTPVAKIEKTRYFEPEIVLEGKSFDETLEYVRNRRDAEGLTLIHPFDDPQVIAGQGSLGLEILDQLPDVETVVIPIGGGGLISGIATAIKSVKPTVRIVGVQSEHCDPVFTKFQKREWAPGRHQISIADGIAVKQPGLITLPIIDRLVDDIVVVGERAIETAIFHLLDIEKTLVEGAGAVSVAAVESHPDIAHGRTLCVISGGNVDLAVVSTVMQRSLVRASRIVRLRVSFPDVPGSLSKLANDITETDSNIVDVFHRRSFASSTLDQTIAEITVQVQGEDDKQSLIRLLRERGHNVDDAEYPVS